MNLSLILIQFDLTFRWRKQATEIEIVPIPAAVRIVRRHTATRMTASRAAELLRSEMPRLPVQVERGKLIVQGTIGIATAILDAAALSFLGLGAQPPTPEWGTMLGAERNQVFTAPHLVFFPGAAIMLIVLAFNLLGDGLRDALDPRLNR